MAMGPLTWEKTPKVGKQDFPVSDNSWLEIDLGKVAHNAGVIRRMLCASGASLCAVVKADGYGIGADPLVGVLSQCGTNMFAVFGADQARTLSFRAFMQPILLMAPVRTLVHPEPLDELLFQQRLHFTIHDLAHLKQVNQIGIDHSVAIPVHLMLDTGMSRSGFSFEQFGAAVKLTTDMPGVELAGLMTHAATAESDEAFLQQQRQRFVQAVKMVDPDLQDDVTLHMANSAATCRGASYHFDMVRVGLALLGYDHGLCADIQPCMKWCSRLMHVQSYPAGRLVGYGSTFTLQRQSLLGVVPVGFADGYPLSLSNCGKVKVSTNVGDHVVPVLGRVNMDQIVVDLTDLPTHEIPVGTLVQVIDDSCEGECSLPQLAEVGKTHVYEMLCRLSWHVPRRYVTTPVASLNADVSLRV